MDKATKKDGGWILWQDDQGIEVVALENPHWPKGLGGHIIVFGPSKETPYEDYGIYAKMTVIAAACQKALSELSLAPHANIQINGNWAFRRREESGEASAVSLEEGLASRRVHVHIYGRKPEDINWGDPIRLPNHRQFHETNPYAGETWPEATLNDLAEFLDEEIPKALSCLI